MVYPNSKINLGLNVVARRPDGFHDIQTVFVPLGLSDVLRVERADGTDGCELHVDGIALDSDVSDNLVAKAWRLMRERHGVGGVRAWLTKRTPFGAGLGGGSADAAFMLKELRRLFSLPLSDGELESLASELGSDCAFFVRNRPVYATGRGEVFHDLAVNLSGLNLALVKPPMGVSTREAYAGIVPHEPIRSLTDTLLTEPVERWQGLVVNDFESTVFALCPRIAQIKRQLTDLGAVYASMSGSGSSVYGLFRGVAPDLSAFPDCFVYTQAF